MTDTHTQQTNKQWMFTYSLAENLMKRIWGGYWLFWCFNCPLYSLPFGEEAVQLPVHCVPYWQPIPTPHVCILYCAKLRLAPRCPHNQRGMTVGTQPGTQVKMSRSLGAVLKRGLTNRSWHGEAWGQLYCCMSTNDTLRFFLPWQVCSWWAVPSSTQWWVPSGCQTTTLSATPTSWRGWPSPWRWSADSSTSSWGSENELSLHPKCSLVGPRPAASVISSPLKLKL